MAIIANLYNSASASNARNMLAQPSKDSIDQRRRTCLGQIRIVINITLNHALNVFLIKLLNQAIDSETASGFANPARSAEAAIRTQVIYTYARLMLSLHHARITRPPACTHTRLRARVYGRYNHLIRMSSITVSHSFPGHLPKS